MNSLVFQSVSHSTTIKLDELGDSANRVPKRDNGRLMLPTAGPVTSDWFGDKSTALAWSRSVEERDAMFGGLRGATFLNVCFEAVQTPT